MPAKQRTKGQREIYEENAAVKVYYLQMSAIVSTLHMVGLAVYIILGWSVGVVSVVGFVACCAVHYAAYRMFKWIATPYFSPSGQLLDGGIDLSIPNGTGEHMKDVVIFTTILQILSLVTTYAWLLVLLVPVRILYLAWPFLKGFLQASTTAPDLSQEQEEEVSAHSKRKKERIKKVHYK